MRRVLSITLPEELSSELDAFARVTGRDKSDIAKEAMQGLELEHKEDQHPSDWDDYHGIPWRTIL